MNTLYFKSFVLSLSLLLNVACSTDPYTSSSKGLQDTSETLYVYEDGRMEYKSRLLSNDEVVIYEDGRGGEKAAVKIRMPIHSDFYHDSIIVVRVVNKFEDSVSQNESELTDNIN